MNIEEWLNPVGGAETIPTILVTNEEIAAAVHEAHEED
jgi:hypothetical protein